MKETFCINKTYIVIQKGFDVDPLRERMSDAGARASGFSLPPVRSPHHSFSKHQTPYAATRYDYQRWFQDFHIHRPIFLTGVFDDYVGWGKGEGNIQTIRNTHHHFLNELHRRIYRKSKRKLPRVVVIERGAGKFHCHIVIETPEHLSKPQFYKIMKDAWGKTRHGVNLHIVNGYDKDGLDRYCSKELGNKDKTFSQVDEKNCFKKQTSSYQPQGGERLVVEPSRKSFPDTLPIIQ